MSYSTQTPRQGTWLILKNGNTFFARLQNESGETVLTSESLTSLSGIKSAIETLKNNILNDNYAIAIDQDQSYLLKIFSTANRVLLKQGGFLTKQECENTFLTAKQLVQNAKILTN